MELYNGDNSIDSSLNSIKGFNIMALRPLHVFYPIIYHIAVITGLPMLKVAFVLDGHTG